MANVIIDECYVNRTHLIGRVISDVVLSQTNEKKIPVLNFKLLTKEFIGSTKKVVTEVHRIVCWNQLAEEVAQRIKRNMTVEVFGQITNRKYRTQDAESGEPVIVALSEIKAFRVTPFKGRIRKVIDTEEESSDGSSENS